jgi:hypothetical protein
VQGARRIAADLSRSEAGDRDPYRLRHTFAPDELRPRNSITPSLEQRQSVLEGHGDDGGDLVGMQHVGVER